MWIHLGLGGTLLLLVLDSVGAPVLAQSSTESRTKKIGRAHV